MQIIFCELQFGDLNQKVYLTNNGNMTFMGEAPVGELPNLIIGLAKSNNVDKVLLRGIHDYALQISNVLINNGLTVEIK